MMAAANPVITAPLQHLYPHPHHPIADKKAMKALPVGKIKPREFPAQFTVQTIYFY